MKLDLNMKRCLNPLTIKGMQIKISTGQHFLPIKLQMSKK